MQLKEMLRKSLETASDCGNQGLGSQALHRERSRIWVETLADEFRSAYAADSSVRVFSKHNLTNKADFGLNELLYDILVCRTATVASAIHRMPLHFVRQALWQVESEFARDSRQALFDFNKLVLGSADNKLFIGPTVNDISAFLKVLVSPSKACSGNVFTALVPHPCEWGRDATPVQLWRFNGDGWSEDEIGT